MSNMEKLKAENFAMKAKIIANDDILSDLSDLSPEVENQFLKHILNIEREPDTRIGDLLPEFAIEKDLTDLEIEQQTRHILAELEKYKIVVDLPASLPPRLAYWYRTEEIIDDKIIVPRSEGAWHIDGCSGW